MRLSIKLKPTILLEKKLSLKAKITAASIIFIPTILILFALYTGFQNDRKIEEIEEKINASILKKRKFAKNIKKLNKQLKNDYGVVSLIENFAENSFWLKKRWSAVLDSINYGMTPGSLKNISLENFINKKNKHCMKWSLMIENSDQQEFDSMIRHMSDNFGNLDFKILSHTLDPFNKRVPDPLEVKLTGVHEYLKGKKEGDKNE